MIDLSILTPEEVQQIKENPSVIQEGDTDVALYMRFSSERQTEQSIEGQLRDAISFCKLKRFRIASIYVDRATSAAKDISKRVHFLQMIADSEKHPWDYVVVWKLDRFARSRSDSALYKMRLKRNGVRVLSVTENISENPEGIILESVLEGMAEFYSAELSQKITRGMRESAMKCNSVGGLIPLGYKLENKKLVIDPSTAHIVQEAFALYADGWTVADICRKFNAAGYRTTKGAEFNRNSFKSMFKNKRYIGVYTYKDVEIEDGVPAIIDKELFEEVGRRLKKNGESPARGKAKVDYLLSGKLFCGHCGSTMNGESGTGKSGRVFHYYKCFTTKKHGNCRAKNIKKDLIESWIAQDAMNFLNQENIVEEIADAALAQQEQDLKLLTKIPELTAKLDETNKGIVNITAAIEKGVASETLMNRLTELEREKKNLEHLLTEEEKSIVVLDRDLIVHWLSRFQHGDIQDEKYKRTLIDLLVNSVTVWNLPDGDYEITIAYNLTDAKSKTFRFSEGSDLRGQAPPFDAYPNTYSVIGVMCVQTKRHSLP